MKTLELIFKEYKDNASYYYLLDHDLVGKTKDISVAVIKVQSNDDNILSKLQKIVDEQYKNKEYTLIYNKLIDFE